MKPESKMRFELFRCCCTSREGFNSAGVNLPGPSTSKNVTDAEPRYSEKMEVDQSSGSG